MRRLLVLLSLIAAPAWADDTATSGLIARQGIAATTLQVEGQTASADRDVALAALRFLGGIEAAMQARWRIGATEALLPLPLLGTTLPGNPEPQPMTADFVNLMAKDAIAAMRSTREVLPDGQGALVMDLRDLWLDVDGDGQRGTGEGLAALSGLPLPDGPAVVRFDAADSHWLRAYTHLIEGVGSLILAFDPQPALERRLALAELLAQQFAEPPGQMARAPNLDQQALAFGPIVDRVAVALQTLRHQPDPALTREARDQLRAMIAANRAFWTEVAPETDDEREWIPNDRQTAALGFRLPPGTGDLWLSILHEVDAALAGRMLVPFWRFAPGYGVDLARWVEDPQPVDPVDWVQGTAALPYARPGLTVGADNWNRFLSVFGGQAGLYMVLLN